jgi:hypothetical protein
MRLKVALQTTAVAQRAATRTHMANGMPRAPPVAFASKELTMKICVKLGLSFALALAPFALVGCGEAADEVSNHIDCRQVCQRYADCIATDYDVDGCEDKCESSADEDAARERKLEMCDSCIDDRSCTDATFNCADECLGIVP